jgi:hypothetical protein
MATSTSIQTALTDVPEVLRPFITGEKGALPAAQQFLGQGYDPIYGELLTTKEVTSITGFTLNQLRNHRQRIETSPFSFVRQGGTSWYRKDDIDLWLFHQANLRINEHICLTLKIPTEKVYNNIQKYGNTSSATIPTLLDECVRSGRLKAGAKVMTTAFGAGFTWGAALVVWGS